MSSLAVFKMAFWQNRRSTFWWAFGLAVLGALTIAFVPTITEDTESFQALFENLPEGLLAVFGIEDAAALGTGVGLVNSRLYSGFGPALISILGITLGVGTLVGEEDKGTLNLLASQPVSRTQLVAQKMAACTLSLLIVGLVLLATVAAGSYILDLGFSVENMVAANLGLVLVGLVFAALALAIGAATGRRSLAVGLAAALSAAAFFVNGLAPLVDELSWAQQLSPYHWLQEPNPLANGFTWSWLAISAAAAAAFFVLAVVAFNNRDIDI